jgi:hypothetical protein
VVIWYIFIVLVNFNKKNLATLFPNTGPVDKVRKVFLTPIPSVGERQSLRRTKHQNGRVGGEGEGE